MGCLDRVVDNAAEKQEALMTNYCEYVHNKFNKYAIGFFFCELLNLVITISQIFVTHAFLNYQYFDYGYLVYQYYSLDSETRSLRETFNPMCEVFPNVAACNWWRWGKDGGQELKNLICILGNNIINQKLFALLWVWHCVLVPVGVIRILTRLFQLCSPHLRIVLYMMNKNMNKRFFAEFLSALSLKVNPQPDEDDEPEINIIKDKLTDDDDNYIDVDETGEPMLEMNHNPHSNWKIPWKKRSTMFVGKRKPSTRKK